MRLVPRFRLGVAAMMAAVLLSLQPAPARAGLLGDVLQLPGQLLPIPTQRVIVQTNGTPTGELLNLVQLLGGRVLAVFETIDGFVADLPLPLVGTLLQRLDVAQISPDLPVVGALDVTNAAIGSTAARTGSGLDGRGVGVAVLDTGIAQHQDLSGRIVGWKDLVNNRASAYDDSGHGTHVAGIIAGGGTAARTAGRDLRGVAPGASLIGVKILDSQMHGYTSTAIKGLDFCASKRSVYNIRVVNLSLGQQVVQPAANDPLCRAVEALWKKGIVVVVSAGNLGRQVANDPNSGVRYGTITSPGNDPLAITVGATKANGTGDTYDDLVATYSSRGPTAFDHVVKPDVVAPGNRVLSLGVNGTMASAYPNDVVTLGGARYQVMSGTSMACPVVSGTVALMLQGDPRANPDTVKIRLMHTARKHWGDASDAFKPYDRGAGLIDAAGALQSRETALFASKSPSLLLSGSGAMFPSGSAALTGSSSSYYDDSGSGTYGTNPTPPTTSYPPSSPPNSNYWSTYTPPPSYPGGSGSYPGGSGSYPGGSGSYPGGSGSYPGGSGSYPGGSTGYNPPPDNTQILWGEPSLYADSAFWDDEEDRTGVSGEAVTDP